MSTTISGSTTDIVGLTECSPELLPPKMIEQGFVDPIVDLTNNKASGTLEGLRREHLYNTQVATHLVSKLPPTIGITKDGTEVAFTRSTLQYPKHVHSVCFSASEVSFI